MRLMEIRAITRSVSSCPLAPNELRPKLANDGPVGGMAVNVLQGSFRHFNQHRLDCSCAASLQGRIAALEPGAVRLDCCHHWLGT